MDVELGSRGRLPEGQPPLQQLVGQEVMKIEKDGIPN